MPPSLTTAVIRPAQTYSISLFTEDQVNLSRNLETGKGVDKAVKITSNGTIGVDEYQAHTRENQKRVMKCNLLPVAAAVVQHDEITASGLFHSGQYLSHREITNESTRSQTSINGDRSDPDESREHGREHINQWNHVCRRTDADTGTGIVQ